MPDRISAIAVLLVFFSCQLSAAQWSLSVQPILPPDRIQQAYQPLAKYLSERSGEQISIRTHRNFIAYWASMRKQDGFDLVLDAPHFTGYRLKNMGYHLLARIPDTVSFSLVTHEDNLIFDTDELVLKTIATLPPPSIGAIRLLEIFPDPFQQPRLVYVDDSLQAAQKVIDGKAVAAMIPTALVSGFEQLNTVMTTEPLPHMAFSASPDMPKTVRDRIQAALLDAASNPKGQKMLQALRFPAFIKALPETYLPYTDLLRIMPNYR